MKYPETLCSRRTFLALSGGVVTGNSIIRCASSVCAQEKEQKKQELLDTAYKLGFDYLSNGKYPGCALCTLAAIQDTLDIRDDTVFKAASGMSGGGGGTGVGNCGSYTGCALVIGQLCGCDRSNPDNRDDYKKSSRIVTKVIEEFNREYGSVICRDIQVKVFGRYFDFKDKDEVARFREAGAKEKCGVVVGKGAQWAVELIIDEGLVKV